MIREGLLPNGTAIGRYIVEERVGAGGMGDVYSALDTTLGRRVALKIVPSSLANDPGRVERFMREARAASSLNHPAIVTVYDSGIADGVPYLAMELIEGETFAQWTHGGRNGNKVAAALAQIADGLARAHANGIIHRDLKPENIMIARGGFPKILDFGIAKLTERDRAATAAETAPSAMLGTASFMSPEQVEGRAVDHRSDIFALGCVMFAAYEGRSPFERETAVGTMNAVVNDAVPPFSAPAHVQRIARRCLSKDPEERYQSIKDVALDLRETPVEIESRPKARPLWLAAPLLLAGLAGVVIWILGARNQEPPQMTMDRITYSGKAFTGAISPDGKYVVHATVDGDTEAVWVRQLATGTDVRIIPPADGFYADMRVSPDGNWVFFVYAPRSNPNVQDVYQVPILGGESRKVAENIDGLFTLSPDGTRIAYRRFSALDRVQKIFVRDIAGGTETMVLSLAFPKFVGGAPAWAPDGEHLTVVTGVENDVTELPSIGQLDLKTGKIERINTPAWPNIGTITWLPDGSGFVLCASERQQTPQVWFVPAKGGAPRKITSDIATYGDVSVTSDSKTIAAHRVESSINLWLVPVDKPQEARAITTGLGNYFGTGGVKWISDREFIYTVFSGESRPSLKALDIITNHTRQIAQGWICWNLAVSPDRSRIAYSSDRGGKIDIWSSDVNGGNLRQATHAATGGTSVSFFPDNRNIAYVTFGKQQAVWKSSIDGGDAPMRLTDQPANTPQVSPDGNALLCRYRTVENGLPLWRTAIVPIGKGEPSRYYPIPKGGGPHVFQWLENGRAFSFIDSINGASNVWVQEVAGGTPRQITQFDSGKIAAYHISPNGKWIVAARGDPVNDMVLIRGFR